MENILENLNERQKKAVIATDGPVLIIAGPGSGKTKVLTHRIAYIIGKGKINPTNILAVTFTNKAAQEMKNRVGALLKETVYANNPKIHPAPFEKGGVSNIQYPVIGTFHNICVRILRQEAEAVGYKKSFVIYDGDDQISMIKKIMKELEVNSEQFNPRSILSHISNAKNELKRASQYYL